MTELPDGVFRAFLSAITGVVAVLWAIHDVVLLARLRGANRRDPLVADKQFGYAIGVVIGVIGIVGTLRYNGVL
jgi:NAD/NADP transhydrogenase beta subunit